MTVSTASSRPTKCVGGTGPPQIKGLFFLGTVFSPYDILLSRSPPRWMVMLSLAKRLLFIVAEGACRSQVSSIRCFHDKDLSVAITV